MKLTALFFMAAILTANCQTSKVDSLIAKAHLIFEDDFNRSEKDDTKEELGKKWKTNSAARAGGHKQADLRDGVLFVEMYKDADHGTSIAHPIPIHNGIVKVKFKMLSVKGLQFNFSDPKANKVAHVGHVCQVNLTPKQVKLTDQITGVFRMDIYEKRKQGIDKEAVNALLKDKSNTHKVDLKINQWYEITMVFEHDLLSVYMDNQFVGALKSEGIDHNPKETIAFSLWNAAGEFDDLKVWSLD